MEKRIEHLLYGDKRGASEHDGSPRWKAPWNVYPWVQGCPVLAWNEMLLCNVVIGSCPAPSLTVNSSGVTTVCYLL
jgi:hypothetical protein